MGCVARWSVSGRHRAGAAARVLRYVSASAAGTGERSTRAASRRAPRAAFQVGGAAGQHHRGRLPQLLVAVQPVQDGPGPRGVRVGGAVGPQGFHLIQAVQHRKHQPVTN